jgi:hypothetical protein
MSIFDEIKKAIENNGRHVVAAKVVATDPALLTADVIFEGEQVTREKVPIRIFTDDDGGLGVGWIPKVGSDVLVAFIDGVENRPQIIKVQQWDQLIIKKGAAGNQDIEITIDSDNKIDLRKASGFQFTIDAQEKVSIGNTPSHKLGWGDAWLQKFNAHTHPTPTGPSGPPMQPLADAEVNSQIFTVE